MGRVPSRIRTGGDLGNELANGNHRSAMNYGGEVLVKAAVNVALGRAIVFSITRAKYFASLRIYPVGVVEK